MKGYRNSKNDKQTLLFKCATCRAVNRLRRESRLQILGTLRSEDGDGRQEKANSRSSNFITPSH